MLAGDQSFGTIEYGGVGSGTLAILTADPGSFTTTGHAPSLVRAGRLAVAPGSFDATGRASSLVRGFLLTAASELFFATGQTVSLAKADRLAVAPGSFDATGQELSLIRGSLLAIDRGPFAATGQATSLVVRRGLPIGSVTFALSRPDARPLFQRLISANTGAFGFSGQDVELTPESTANFYFLATAPGAFSASAQAASLVKGSLLTCAPESFVATGEASSLIKAFLLASARGSFAATVTGQVALISRRKVSADAMLFDCVGIEVRPLHARRSVTFPVRFILRGYHVRQRDGVVFVKPGGLTVTALHHSGRASIALLNNRVAHAIGYGRAAEGINVAWTEATVEWDIECTKLSP